MPAGLIRVFDDHRRSVGSPKHNGGYLIAVQTGVDGNDTGDAGLPVACLASIEPEIPRWIDRDGIGVVDDSVFSGLVVMVMLARVLTPPALKWSLQRKQ